MDTALINGGSAVPDDESCFSSSEIQALKEELYQLTEEFTKANEERAQAAKYGLHVLEEKQVLRAKYDELTGLYDDTKLELDKSVEVGGARV